MLLPVLCIPAFAADIFNYDKFINNPAYEVRAETRNNFELDFYWGDAYPDKVTDTGEKLLLYYLFNAQDAEEKPGYRLLEQKVHLKYKLPSVYTSLYTPGRKYRYYDADFSAGHNDVEDNMLDDNIEEYQYQYYYEDFSRENNGLQPGETEAYTYGYVVAHSPQITLYHMKYDNTPAMEDAAQKQYEEWNKEKEANTDERDTITVERQGGGDSILVAYHSLWDDSPKETYKCLKYHEGGSTLIEELKYESTQETYEYYYYTRIPGISDAYTVNHVLLNRLTGYKIGLVSPKKEAVDLYNDMMEKWKATVAMAPTLYSMMPEVIADEPIIYEDFNIAGVTKHAETDPGEDGGVSVPSAVVVSVLGGGAAIAGAAAASGSSDSKKKKQKAYKMYVQKDFGDAIRRGGEKPVKIRARMAEVDESGAEHDRNDLTANIGVSADGMTVHGAALAGRYCEAAVSVPKEYDNDTASITFTFTGEGGSFTNTVIFRIVDGPSLKFVEETEKAGDFRLYTGVAYIEAIPGDGFTYTEQFMIVDAPVAPKLSDITAVNTGNYGVKFELTDRQAVYKMTVKNNTKPEPEHDVFAKVKEENFEIHVTVEGEKEPVKGYVTVKLYPEGITVQSRDEGKKNSVKYVRVQAYEKEYVGDLDKKWQVSQIIFTLAAIGKDKAIIDPGEAKYKFEKLKGAGGLGMRAYKEQNLAEKYEYKEVYGEMNGKYTYEFEPNANLAEPEDGTFMMVLLPASCKYGGTTYEAEIPLRLRGKDPDPMADWEKEYKELCRRVEKYSLPQNKDKWLKQVKECAVDPKVSVEELRLVSKWILREYMAYWTTQQSRDQSEAAWCNVIVNTLEWTKFAGDCAFSLLVTMYAGPVAEALISPAKDFITGAIGEVIAARNYGEEVDVDKFEFSKNLAAAGDNLVSNSIDLKNWRKAAATLGCYFSYCAIKNYLQKLNEKGESDIWGSLCDAFKDMTASALKSKAGDLIGKWLKESKTFQEKIGPFIAKYFKETNFDTLQKQLNDSLGLEGELRKLAGYANDKVFEAKVADAVEKYIGGLVGAGFDKVREVYDGSKFVVEGGYVYYCFNIDLFDAFHYGIKLNLTKTLQAMSGDFFGWFYDLFFAGVPAAQSVMKKPQDPPLPPEKD